MTLGEVATKLGAFIVATTVVVLCVVTFKPDSTEAEVTTLKRKMATLESSVATLSRLRSNATSVTISLPLNPVIHKRVFSL